VEWVKPTLLVLMYQLATVMACSLVLMYQLATLMAHSLIAQQSK
jgi:hypothetical protein